MWLACDYYTFGTNGFLKSYKNAKAIAQQLIYTNDSYGHFSMGFILIKQNNMKQAAVHIKKSHKMGCMPAKRVWDSYELWKHE